MFEIVSLFGLMVSALLIVNTTSENKSRIYLSLFFLSISIFSLTRNFIFYVNHPYILYYFLPGAIPFFNLSAPLLYLYIKKSLSPDESIMPQGKEFWHFFPMCLSLVNILPHMLLSPEIKIAFIKSIVHNPFQLMQLKTLLFPIEYNLLLRPLIGIIYSIAAFKIYLNRRATILQSDKSFLSSNLNWFAILLICSGLNFFSAFLIGLFAQHGAYRVSDVAEIKLFMLIPTLFLLILNSSIFFFPRILYGVNSRRPIKKELSSKKVVSQDFDHSTFEHLISDSLNPESTNHIISQKLAEYFTGKPFLQPGFTLSVISKEMNIPYHQLTTYYNNFLGINFNDWKNNARIDYAIELINNGRAKNLTLESIAIMCGFLSRSNFVNAFRKKTGLTPSEYLKRVNNRSPAEKPPMVIKLGFS
jgi:AraC-like DNA-binding protein